MKSYSVSVNGKVFQVDVQENQGGMAVKAAPMIAAAAPMAAPAAPKAAPAPAAPKPAAPAAPAAGGGAGTVEAPMPGKILSISVKVGDTVPHNGVLCILEAMKMENEICAPVAGTVTGIHVAVGDTVDTSTLLFTIG